jgi:hypothetical protein
MSMTWILLVYVWGARSSMHDHVEFSSQANCEAAAAKIRQGIEVKSSYAALVCVRK